MTDGPKVSEFITAQQNSGLYDWLDRCSRWLLALVFLLAGMPKIMAPVAFAEIIGAYGLLPELFLLPVAVVLPLAEVVAAVALLRGRREGLWAAALMMFVFIAVLGYGIQMGLDIDCGCFGPEDPEHEAFSGLRAALLRDILLCIPITYAFRYQYKHTSELHGETQ